MYSMPRHDAIDNCEPDLFGTSGLLPPGFRYEGTFLSPVEECALADALDRLEFETLRFRGFEGRRRVVSFGWRYDYDGGGLVQAAPMPPFLLRLRDKAAAFARLPSERLQQVLLTDYPPGAAIGWHKDKSVFGNVVGVSLLSDCVLRFRRPAERGWQRQSARIAPRSIYLLAGPARSEWQHSISPVGARRCSITFREYVAPHGE